MPDDVRGAVVSPVRGRTAIRAAAAVLSPAGRRARLSTLIFHRVHAARDPLSPNELTADLFRARMAWVRDCFNVLPLDAAVAALSRGTLPERALAITFDDGYRDNVEVALPILQDLGLPATFFIATGFLDGGRMWNDSLIEAVRAMRDGVVDIAWLGLPEVRVDAPESRRALIAALIGRLKYEPPGTRLERVAEFVEKAGVRLPDDLMMTSDHVRALAAAGMGIGAHTATHPILARLDDGEARREVATGRERLEALTGRRVALFAYPNGKPGSDYTAAHVGIAEALGFDAAFSTAWGAARASSPRFELPRFTPWDRTPLRWGLRLLRNYFVDPATTRR